MTCCLVVVVSALFASCRRAVEMRGLYANEVTDGASGVFVACDQPKPLFHVRDSALASTYRVKARVAYQPLFVRLRGVRADSGSIYEGQRYLLVRELLEMREPRVGDCPRASAALPLFHAPGP